MFKRLGLVLVLIFAVGFVLAAYAQDDSMGPDEVVIVQEGLYPEGLEYDAANNVFLISSLTQGTIHTVADDGTLGVFVQDEALISTIGIRFDAANNRLLVCNSDPGASPKSTPETQGTLAALVAYDLTTKAQLFYADLGGLVPNAGHFCNDIALAADGTVYVTDSFSPIIYRVDTEGNAEVFLQADALAGEGFGLNGIVYHPNGYLLVAKANTGDLLKVPMDDPSAYTLVEVEMMTFVGADGLILAENGDLVLITNSNGIFLLDTDDNWATATIEGELPSGEDFPTTGTLRDGYFYMLNGDLGQLFDPNAPTATEFVIERLDFE